MIQSITIYHPSPSNPSFPCVKRTSQCHVEGPELGRRGRRLCVGGGDALVQGEETAHLVDARRQAFWKAMGKPMGELTHIITYIYILVLICILYIYIFVYSIIYIYVL